MARRYDPTNLFGPIPLRLGARNLRAQGNIRLPTGHLDARGNIRLPSDRLVGTAFPEDNMANRTRNSAFGGSRYSRADPRYGSEDTQPDYATPSSVVPVAPASSVVDTRAGYPTTAAGGTTAIGPGSSAQGDITSPFTGFASAFTPGAAPGIFDNPNIALMQAMKNMGYTDLGANQGLYQMMLPQMNYANQLAMLALGQGSNMGAGANNAALNFMGDYATNLMTPGGQAIDFNKGLAALGTGANPNSVIGQFMNVDDPFQQVKNYQALALPLAASSLHPFFARAFQNAIQQAGDQYTYAMSGPNINAGNFSSFFPGNSPFAGQ